jgi:succinoglycan biosynthesis protein ExoM
MPSPDCTIVILTFRRPLLLRQCLESCVGQSGIEAGSVDLLVVDNSPEASAAATVREFQGNPLMPVRYHHVPAPDIAKARNVGLAKANGRSVAFMDDDQVATERWLASLLDTQMRHEADVVFGPVRRIVERGDQGRERLARKLYADATKLRTGTEVTSAILRPFWRLTGKACARLGSGNCLIRRSELTARRQFSSALGRTGGEDTLYFNQLILDGARIRWCAEAVAWEHVPPDRMTRRYVAMRAFRGGQVGSFIPLLLTPRKPALTFISFAIGMAQLPVFSALWLFGLATHSARRHVYMVQVMGAAGKIFWGAAFRSRVYGATEAPANPVGGRIGG